ncbi:uncharacterized protein BDW70DRAFT_141800 [Aspergillus foveolatus]|uniref:uncharacterized protein n=1 Tax=Aspergillus foveolatus TaxID=210207 RepID=UPI003CCD8B6C
MRKSNPKRAIYISCVSWLATGSTKNRYAIESTSTCGRLGTMQEARSSSSLQAIVEVTYLTVMIQMLFPHGLFDNWALTGYVLCDFLTEAASLLNTISSSTRDNPSLKADAVGCFTTAAEIFALGLGICVRAMQYISSRQLTGSEAEQDLITANSAGLLELLLQMHQIAKSEVIMQTKRIDSLLLFWISCTASPLTLMLPESAHTTIPSLIDRLSLAQSLSCSWTLGMIMSWPSGLSSLFRPSCGSLSWHSLLLCESKLP